MSFGTEIKAYVSKTKSSLEIVAKMSIGDVVEIAQTPGPTVASTKKAIAQGIGKGRNKKKFQGPPLVGNKGGRMPVDTGTLRNSLASGLNGSFGDPSSDGYTLVIAGMELGDIAQFGWTAEYALRMEYGFSGTDSLGRHYNQQGYYFVSSAAAQWPQIVDKNARKVDG